MRGNEVVVEKVNHEDAAVARRLIELLRPRETHALFLLGNLLNGYPDSHLYVARRGEERAGVAGFYERPKSCSVCAEEPEIVRALIRHVVPLHPSLEMVLAVDPIGRWGTDAMTELGFALVNEPRQVFMEMVIPDRFERVPHEERVRAMEERDAMACARLQRYLSAPDDHSPVRQEELERALGNRMRLVLEVNGEVVSTATTNGLAIEAFQILGVATSAEHRGRGYAGAVCAALIRRMQGKGASRCVLFTGLGNLAARRCYERLGFRAAGHYCLAKFKPPALVASQA
jgi:ribosomal protein S18 acetylase RimI-like enzyme